MCNTQAIDVLGLSMEQNKYALTRLRTRIFKTSKKQKSEFFNDVPESSESNSKKKV